MKNPLTPAGIEPATFQFGAQHLNHCATAVPHFPRYHMKIIFVEFSAKLGIGYPPVDNWERVLKDSNESCILVVNYISQNPVKSAPKHLEIYLVLFWFLYRACCQVTQLFYQPLHLHKLLKITHLKRSDMFRS